MNLAVFDLETNGYAGSSVLSASSIVLDEAGRLSLSLLAGREDVQTQALPGAQEGDTRPFEVVGIPLEPGFHVLEIASRQLGSSLLDERYGPQRTMYVRTSALVTNLGVHFKRSPEGALVWVTTLDHGKPVAGAAVRVSNCTGKLITH